MSENCTHGTRRTSSPDKEEKRFLLKRRIQAKIRGAKDLAMELAKDPVVWVCAGFIGFYAAGHRDGLKQGFADGAFSMLKEYTDTLNAYDVEMPPAMKRDVKLGRIWFLEDSEA